MKIHYDPSLVEEVIGLEVKRGEEEGDLRRFQQYHALADSLYERFSPKGREAAFERLHQRLFLKWRFGEPVSQALEEFPEVKDQVEEVFVARALAKKEEGADLSRDQRGIGVKVRPERFLEAEGLRCLLRHELQHIADMLDPAFDYIPHAVPASSPTEESLIKDRYRTLWAISVDGRLWRGGKGTIASKEDRWREFQALYPTIPHQKRFLLFEDLWGGDRPSHRELLEMAKDPRRLLERVGGMVEEGLPKKVLLPGAPCPLCRFPTYRWVEEFEEGVAGRIKADFPTWEPAEGACERCAEVYSLGVMPIGRGGTRWN